MKLLLKITFIVLCISFYACKNETQATFNDFKYADKENVLNCDNVDTKLYHEALLSFEDDIATFYNKENTDIRIAYTAFYRSLIGKRVDFQELTSPHTMAVFEALKEQPDLWNDDDSINYHADIFGCLSSNFNDKGFGTTFNSLVTTNSMRLDLISAPLQNQIKGAHSDRYLAMYIALDLYYSNLIEVDPTKVTKNTQTNEGSKTESKNKLVTPAIDNIDPHAGHDH